MLLVSWAIYISAPPVDLGFSREQISDPLQWQGVLTLLPGGTPGDIEALSFARACYRFPARLRVGCLSPLVTSLALSNDLVVFLLTWADCPNWNYASFWFTNRQSRGKWKVYFISCKLLTAWLLTDREDLGYLFERDWNTFRSESITHFLPCVFLIEQIMLTRINAWTKTFETTQIILTYNVTLSAPPCTSKWPEMKECICRTNFLGFRGLCNQRILSVEIP